MNISQEYKEESDRLRLERDILREILAEELQSHYRCPPAEAQNAINTELMSRLQNARRP